MTSLLLSVLIPATVLAAEPKPAPAASAALPVATITKMSGIVRIGRDGNDQVLTPAVTGIALNAGDTVLVLQGRAEIQFTAGNVIRLNRDTTLRVVPPADPAVKKTFLAKTFARLIKGSIKAIVKAVNKDEGFAVESQSAIASVKGTEFLFDGMTVRVKDEGDAGAHLVELTGLRGGRSILIGEGMGGGINGDGSFSEPKPFDPAAVTREEQDLEGDLGGGTGGAAGGGSTGGGDQTTQGGEGGDGTQGGGEGGDGDLSAELRDEMGDWSEDNWGGDFADRFEHLADLTLGTAAIDRHGYRVEVEESVRLAAANQVQIMVLNHRDGGPHAGLTYMQSDFFFNRELPADNFEGIRRNLPFAFADPNTQPEFWTTKEEQTFVNPAGDAMVTRVLLSDPELVYDYVHADGVGGTWNYTPWSSTVPYAQMGGTTDPWDGAPHAWKQGIEFSKYLQFGGGALVPKEHFQLTPYGNVAAGWYAGVDPATTTPVYPTGTYATPGGTIDGQPTAWAVNGASVIGNDPDAPPMFAYDFAFRDISGYNYGGLPDFNNPYFGTGSIYGYFNGDGGLTTETVYGDGTSIRESMFFVSTQGNVYRLDGLLEEMSGEGGDVVENTGFNFEYEVEFNETPEGDMHGVDLLIDPAIFEDAGPAAPDMYDYPPAPEYQPYLG